MEVRVGLMGVKGLDKADGWENDYGFGWADQRLREQICGLGEERRGV